MSVKTQEMDLVKVLNDDGTVVNKSIISEVSDGVLKEIYSKMKLVRRYDKRAVSLQRQGRIGTYPPLYGHEAVQVASVLALDEDDQLFPSYRENGAIITKGGEIEQNLKTWMGHETGGGKLDQKNIFPIANPIATHIPHATGFAWASKLKGNRTVALCHFGDGATSEGDFHEGLNFAGVFDVPAVFFCNNNQWAISVPRDRQTASNTLAEKSQAYGFEGIRVDGMDPVAVYAVTQDAVDKAKHPDKGQLRPTLIEAVLYRLGAHSTSDDPSVYRDEKETENWKQKDPIPRLESFLLENGHIDREEIDAIETKADHQIEDAIDEIESFETDPETMFNHVYEELPTELRQQRTELNNM